MSDDLVERLREVSFEKHQEAWGRLDGGQDLTIGAMLAEQAADRIEELEAKLAKAVELALEECPFRCGTPNYDNWWRNRRATLAEIKGGKDGN